MNKNIAVSARFAEVILSPGYRATLAEAHDEAVNPEDYVDQRAAAETLILTAFNAQGPRDRRMDADALMNISTWDLRRRAAITEIGGISLGPFSDYFHDQGGADKPSMLTVMDLKPGDTEVVRTNTKIVGLNKVHTEPIDFVKDALDLIDDQRKPARGPENYATTIKFFADKYQDFPSSHLDQALIKNAVDRCMAGFTAVTEKDMPNFVELNNLYYAIRVLPAGSFDARFTNGIIKHSLEQLPTFNDKTLALMVASMNKLDLKVSGDSAATLIDLALRKMPTMERSANMVQTIRSIANLPYSAAAERTFDTFLEHRNNLESPQDLDGLDSINLALATIVKNVIQDPELSQKAKELAGQCAGLAVKLAHKKTSIGDATPGQVAYIHDTLKRIFGNYHKI